MITEIIFFILGGCFAVILMSCARISAKD